MALQLAAALACGPARALARQVRVRTFARTCQCDTQLRIGNRAQLQPEREEASYLRFGRSGIKELSAPLSLPPPSGLWRRLSTPAAAVPNSKQVHSFSPSFPHRSLGSRAAGGEQRRQASTSRASHAGPHDGASPATSSGPEQPQREQDLEEGRRERAERALAAAARVARRVRRGLLFAFTDPVGLSRWLKEQYPIWLQAAKDEAHHYWLGCKLLGAQTSIAWHLVKRLLAGRELSRSDRRLLKREAADLLRVIPFLVIVVVPFMEFSLPFLLKLFPSMLPSTFESPDQKAAHSARLLQARIRLAHLLQDAVQEMAQRAEERAESGDPEKRRLLADFVAFMGRVKAGAPVSNAELLKYARLFTDDFAIETLPREMLGPMCEYLQLPVFAGSEAILRFELRKTVAALKRDDKELFWEGLEELPLHELREAARARGIRSVGLPRAAVVDALNRWLQLSMAHDVPTSLLLLSRIFIYTQAEAGQAAPGEAEALQATFSALADEVTEAGALDSPAARDEREMRRARVALLEEQRRRLALQARLELAQLAAIRPALASRPAEAGGGEGAPAGGRVPLALTAAEKLALRRLRVDLTPAERQLLVRLGLREVAEEVAGSEAERTAAEAQARRSMGCWRMLAGELELAERVQREIAGRSAASPDAALRRLSAKVGGLLERLRTEAQQQQRLQQQQAGPLGLGQLQEPPPQQAHATPTPPPPPPPPQQQQQQQQQQPHQVLQKKQQHM